MTPLPDRYHDAHVLVAEDEPLNREIGELLLSAVGILPRMAENGRQALDILTEAGAAAFDLVLMDIQMPVMDGLTTARALRRRAEFELLPIIGMTALTLEHEKKRGLEAGFNDHIGKPYDSATFYQHAGEMDSPGQTESGTSIRGTGATAGVRSLCGE